MVFRTSYRHIEAFFGLALGLLASFWTCDALAARYASIVVEAETGRVLHAENADTLAYPASLTKMMTLYLLFEEMESGRLKPNSQLKVSRRAAGMPPSRLGLKAGERISVKDAILALVTKSANDVAVVVAETIAGSEIAFAKRMTSRARALGMSRTTFRNASGLPNRHQKTTARDMATLSRALLQDHADYYHYFATEIFDYAGHSYRNHNNLLGDYQGVDGIKTGYIRQSGFNLAASAKRDGRRLVAVVFGGRSARSRDHHMAGLLDRAFTEVRTMEASARPSLPQPKPLEFVASDALVSGEGDIGGNDGEGGLGLVAEARAASEVQKDAGPRGIWAVQVGAFRSHDPAYRLAIKALRLVPDPLDKGEIEVNRAKSNGLYRARIAGLDRGAAESACRALAARSMACLVLRTRPN